MLNVVRYMEQLTCAVVNIKRLAQLTRQAHQHAQQTDTTPSFGRHTLILLLDACMYIAPHDVR